MHWKYALLHWLYAAPVRVSDIFPAFDFVDVAARTYVPLRDVVRAPRVWNAPERVEFAVAVRVRVIGSLRGLIGKEPARVASVFWARVCGVAVRAESVVARDAPVVVRVVAESRIDVGTDAASRTAAVAGAPANKPRNTPKIRIPFISDKNVSKIYKFWARTNLVFI